MTEAEAEEQNVYCVRLSSGEPDLSRDCNKFKKVGNSVLTVFCNVLQCVEVWCDVLQVFTVCCIELQCVDVCCTVLTCVAVCWRVLQCQRSLLRLYRTKCWKCLDNMGAYILTYIYICIHIHVYVYKRTCIYTYMHICIRIYINKYIYNRARL